MYAIVDTLTNSVVGIRFTTGSLPEGQTYIPAMDSGSYDPETQARIFNHYEIKDGIAYACFDFRSKKPDEIYSDKLAAGYYDSITGCKLKTTKEAQADFSQLSVMLQTLPDGTYSFWDFDDVEHQLPKADIQALLSRYGLFCYQLFCNYAP